MSILSPQQLQDAVQQYLPTIPDNHTNAIVGTLDANGAQVVAVMKLGRDKKWQLSAFGQHEWAGDNNVGGQVIYSW